MLLAHAVQPVGAVCDGHLADGGLDPRVGVGEEHGVAAARAAGAEDADGVGVHVVTGREVGDRVDEVLELASGREDAAVARRVPESAVVEHEHGEPCGDECLVVAHVELGVFEAEPSGALDDRPVRPGALRGAPEACEAIALAVELDRCRLHGCDVLPLNAATRWVGAIPAPV
ncbi:hypothetical protein GCM10025870_20910 [Agromyces marinus]|uniref:Uncharacterized protein n=1 Tax=Agromyces marinus TaxID=1389020 RepID=A0ABN6YCT8_9MICO|nr:hypothetical protein GCM10025870_20910 [Agromyces marinus]